MMSFQFGILPSGSGSMKIMWHTSKIMKATKVMVLGATVSGNSLTNF